MDGGDHTGEDTFPAGDEQVVGYVLLDTDCRDHINSLAAIERVNGSRRHLGGYEILSLISALRFRRLMLHSQWLGQYFSGC